MLCTQIISEYERQTKLLERIVGELEKLNARVVWKGHKNSIGWEPFLLNEGGGMNINKRLLSVEETAEYLGIAPSTIYNRARDKSEYPFPVKPKRVGRRVKFDRDELDAYIDSL